MILPFASCTLPLTTDLTGERDGTFTLEVRATDAAGLTGTVASADYVLDTLAPTCADLHQHPGVPGAQPVAHLRLDR